MAGKSWTWGPGGSWGELDLRALHNPAVSYVCIAIESLLPFRGLLWGSLMVKVLREPMSKWEMDFWHRGCRCWHWKVGNRQVLLVLERLSRGLIIFEQASDG